MIGYILKRLAALVPIVLLTTLFAFTLMQLSPVDPAEAYFSAAHIKADEAMLADKRAELGLDRHFLEQYAQSALQMLQLDFGQSYLSSKPVKDEIMSRLPATLQLAAISLLLATVMIVLLGWLSAIYANKWLDYVIRALSYIGASMPQFMLGFVLMYLLALQLDLVPTEGKGTWQHLVMPAITIAVPIIATYTRLFRENILEQLKQPYVDYANTRGLSKPRIMIFSVIRLAILPVITGLGMNVGRLITGTIIVERVFSWPGLGRFFVESIFNRDLPVIQGYVFFAACVYLVVNLISDLVQIAGDPRVSLREGRS